MSNCLTCGKNIDDEMKFCSHSCKFGLEAKLRREKREREAMEKKREQEERQSRLPKCAICGKNAMSNARTLSYYPGCGKPHTDEALKQGIYKPIYPC